MRATLKTAKKTAEIHFGDGREMPPARRLIVKSTRALILWAAFFACRSESSFGGPTDHERVFLSPSRDASIVVKLAPTPSGYEHVIYQTHYTSSGRSSWKKALDIWVRSALVTDSGSALVIGTQVQPPFVGDPKMFLCILMFDADGNEMARDIHELRSPPFASTPPADPYPAVRASGFTADQTAAYVRVNKGFGWDELWVFSYTTGQLSYRLGLNEPRYGKTPECIVLDALPLDSRRAALVQLICVSQMPGRLDLHSACYRLVSTTSGTVWELRIPGDYSNFLRDEFDLHVAFAERPAIAVVSRTEFLIHGFIENEWIRFRVEEAGSRWTVSEMSRQKFAGKE